MKSVRQVDNLSTSLQDKINLSSTTGLNGKHMPEAIPKYDRSDSEVLYQNKNNASIVLGRDRPGNKLSGYGGAGHSSCGAIDLVVGRMSDSVRLIGRMGIKLVTGTDEKDSIGTDLSAVYGIDLIAGNTDQKYKPLGFPEEIEILQPIPKGDNLVRYLKSLSAKVDELSNLLDSFMKVQQTFNNLTANHIHPTLPTAPFSPGLTMAPTSLQIANPSLGALSASFVKGPNYINRINISTLNSNYLTAAGPLYINSRHNRTT